MSYHKSDCLNVSTESDDSSEDAEGAIAAILKKLSGDDYNILDRNPFEMSDTCTCDFCKELRLLTAGEREELKMMQTYWTELRNYIRIVYRISIKGTLMSIDEEYTNSIKLVASRLCDVCNPLQIYECLENQVGEFVVEIKVRLLQLMDRLAGNPQLPKLFISGMLDSYNKMMNAANKLTPVLSRMETEHLSKFKLTWKILNQRLFQTSIYTDIFFQNSVPLFITQLGKKNNSEENKVLVREFLSFDDEITLVEGMWSDVEEHLKSFKKDSSTNSTFRKYLTQDWEEFKALRRNHYKLCNKHLANQDSDDNSSLNDFDLTNWCEEDENDLNETCECHVCPNVPTNNVTLIDDVLPLNRTGFHLCPHIHIHEKNHTKIEGANVPKDSKQVLKMKMKSWKESYSSKAARSRKGEGATPIVKGQHDKCIEKEKKEASTDTTEVQHNFCPIHNDVMEWIPCGENDICTCDGTEEFNSDTSDTDSRHCDCYYCEVFGHGLPATAPMSRNYKEMRERLRLLLNKKKSKCRSTTVPTLANNTMPQAQPKRHQNGGPPSQEKPQKLQKSDKSTATPIKAPPPPVVEHDPRDLEDLLDFIEGTEVKCRNEKKAAKKARQKEKKILMIRKKKEEEEKARLIQEAIEKKQREEEMLRLAKVKEQENASKSKKKSKNRSQMSQKEDNVQHNKPSENPGTQMVTIKRIMEPHSSEPTVTITLRGATPKQDKVLYTLLNGQVCKVKDVPVESQHSNSKHVSTKKFNNSSELTATKSNKKVKQKKEQQQKVEPTPSAPAKQKPVKQLTNPTSIQINNAINTMSKHPTTHFNINDLKLPPGITITKVDSSESPFNKKVKESTNTKVSSTPMKSAASSEVIVVATNKLKELAPSNGALKTCDSHGNSNNNNNSANNNNNKKKKQKKKDQEQRIKCEEKNPYPGLDIDPIPMASQNDLVRQMSVLTINPYAGSKEVTEIKLDASKKKKKKSKKGNEPINNPDDWKMLDSVFAPKDIDLNDGEIDDAERELEAFKRFCLQSVPPERKAKVHLNLKDIVLKKKSSPVTCN
ncbi:protein FAM193A-like isoform X2 [Cimex lectularius]|uniref:FAM193 C-terminal domain-containing protein n=1 Tax=Cimex lectularius TaxID=79782 RepID=A0A8I6RTS5_CIMLE|nr:protein FAM193A-like isoform X2 [Cimex lectularius]